MRLALAYPSGAVARELVDATLAMIGGQQLDLEGGVPLDRLHALKTGALFSASVMCGLWAADVPLDEHPPWRAFAGELGLLFQVVDDLLDGDGYVLEVGEDGARRLADEAAERARARLAEVDGDTDVLLEIVDGLAVRTV
jgi:geranylgeranyl diphosphate synthase type II